MSAFREILICDGCGEPFRISASTKGSEKAVRCPYCGVPAQTSIGRAVAYQIAPHMRPTYRRMAAKDGMSNIDRRPLTSLPSLDS